MVLTCDLGVFNLLGMWNKKIRVHRRGIRII